MSIDKIRDKISNVHVSELIKKAAKKDLYVFARKMKPELTMMNFHKVYYKILDMFAHGKIKKLIITMPPQHGKSEGSSRLLPSFMLGLNPNLKIAIGSYAATIARDFNRDVQKIIDTPEYRELFPDTYLNRTNAVTMSNVFQRNSDVLEIVNKKGGLRVVGRGGGLTSKTVDIAILDDVYKDYEEGNSPTIRRKAWRWYISVVRSRLHDDSQELIVFTRWHENDIIGRLEKLEKVITVTKWDDLNNIPEGAWIKLNFQAIKTDQHTELDNREIDTALWDGRHSLSGLLAKKNLDVIQFNCLYQGNPAGAEGKLYQSFKTYNEISDYGIPISVNNYTDTKDTGKDNLLSISYTKVRSPHLDKFKRQIYYLLVKDLVYNNKGVEYNLPTVSKLINDTNTNKVNVESNNGGSIFAKMLRRHCPRAKIDYFHQSKNKESRIISNSGLVQNHIVFPIGWETKYVKFHEDLTGFLRDFRANEHDDVADVLTGMIEKDITQEMYSQGVIVHD